MVNTYPPIECRLNMVGGHICYNSISYDMTDVKELHAKDDEKEEEERKLSETLNIECDLFHLK